MVHETKPIIALFGPTGGGKTKLGVSLAQTLDGEVISIDSLQCYNAGHVMTAAPAWDETQGIPHHMVDYLPHDSEPSPNGEFIEQAIQKADDIWYRGKIPILVGGSTSLTLPMIRKVLANGGNLITLILAPELRNPGYRKGLDSRIDEMLKSGLLDEVRTIRDLDRSGNHALGVRKAIGYRELLPVVGLAVGNPDRDVVLDKGIAEMQENTFQYAIQQMEFLESALLPFLTDRAVPTATLPVPSNASEKRELEMDAIAFAQRLLSRRSRGPDMPISSCRVVCVFAGSSSGHDPCYDSAARALAHELHRHGIKLVYGGGTTGAMGCLASTLVALSGPEAVHGIIPRALAQHEAKLPEDVRRLYAASKFGQRTVVKDMHTRKRAMADAVQKGAPGSGFVALPGGYGTLEELLEMITWKQLGIHSRPIVAYNANGFYGGMQKMFTDIAYAGFIPPSDAAILQYAQNAEDVVEALTVDEDGNKHGLEWESS